ncbi:MAG: cytochrome c oxidase assembly protein [Acidimicrobiales bacterium]
MGQVPPLWGIWLEPRAWGQAFTPGAAGLLVAVSLAYAVGATRQRRQVRATAEMHASGTGGAASGRPSHAQDRAYRRHEVDPSVVVTPARQILFYAGMAVVAFAVMSPLDVLSQWLFSAHMLQHLLLLLGAPLLLVASAPLDPLRRALPESVAARLIGLVTAALDRFSVVRLAVSAMFSPWGAMAAFAGTMWLWHLPALYDLTLSNQWVHVIEHAMFLAAGLLWWSRLIGCPPLRAPLSPATASIPSTVIFLLGTVAQNVILAMVIGYAHHPLYAPYAALVHRPGGLSALGDQEFGASLMWTLGELPIAVALARLTHLWMSSLEAEEVDLAGRAGRAADGG